MLIMPCGYKIKRKHSHIIPVITVWKDGKLACQRRRRCLKCIVRNKNVFRPLGMPDEDIWLCEGQYV